MITLPSGLGTLKEIFTIISWENLNIHRKPIGVFNIDHFFFLLVFLEDAKRLRFISKSAKDIVLTAGGTAELINQLLACELIIDLILSKLDRSDNDRGKKRRVDLIHNM